MRILPCKHSMRRMFQLLAASLLLQLLTVSGEEIPTPTTFYDGNSTVSSEKNPTPTTFYDDSTGVIDYADFEVIIYRNNYDIESEFELGSGSFMQPGYITVITVFLYLICYIWH